MSVNIVEAIRAHVTKDELQTVSTAIGESTDKTHAAVSIGVLAIVGSVLQRGSSLGGAASILSTLESPKSGGTAALTASFLGDRGNGIATVVAKSSGISPASAHRVLAALLPIAATVLGREVASRNLSANGFYDFLALQKEKFGALPGANVIAGAVGLPAFAAPHVPDYRAGEYVRSVPTFKEPVSVSGLASRPKSRRWIPLAVALGAVALGALLLGRRTDRVMEAPRAEMPEAVPVPAPPVLRPAPPEPTSVTTVTAAEIPKGDALGDAFAAKDVPDKLTLDDVTFDFATANLRTGQDTVGKVVVLMKEHPASVLRLEGHTDSVGNDPVNESLSMKRAAAVKKMLVDDGVDATRIEAVGKGERDPVSSNDTEEGRAKNRRIDAVIIKR